MIFVMTFHSHGEGLNGLDSSISNLALLSHKSKSREFSPVTFPKPALWSPKRRKLMFLFFLGRKLYIIFARPEENM